MGGFFDPNPRPGELFEMYGAWHLVLLLLMLALIPIMSWQRERVIQLRANRRFMVWLSIIILVGEVQEYTMMWVHHYRPAYELYPFHLCGMLAFALPILTLFKKYRVLRFIASWSVAAGLISLLNLGITHNDPGQLTFFHYFWKHYYLFLYPVFLFIAGDYEVRYRDYVKSMAGLLALSGVVFLANWALGTNYMYIGPENEMAVPFLPDALMEWPIIYPSFIGVGLILFHIIFVGFALAQRQRRRRNPTRPGSADPGTTVSMPTQ